MSPTYIASRPAPAPVSCAISSPITTPTSAKSAKHSFWTRRRSDRPAEISAPVLISRSDVGRKCIPLETARQCAAVAAAASVDLSPTASEPLSSTFSPLRMNPVSASARVSTVSSAGSSQSIQSAPARMDGRDGSTIPSEFAKFTPLCQPASSVSSTSHVPSVISSVVSSRFSVWSDSDSSEDDDDCCVSIVGDEDTLEPAFENVTPVSPRLPNVDDIGADLFALSHAARDELSKATTVPGETGFDCGRVAASRARMAIYIPSTSSAGVMPIPAQVVRKPSPMPLTIQVPRVSPILSSYSSSDDTDEDIEDEVSSCAVFYPAVPGSLSASMSPAPASTFSGVHPSFSLRRQTEQEFDELLSAYE